MYAGHASRRLILPAMLIGLVAASTGACGNGGDAGTTRSPSRSLETTNDAKPASSAQPTMTSTSAAPATVATTTTAAPTTATSTTLVTTGLPSTTVPQAAPTEIHHAPSGDVAFLGPIYTVPVGELSIAYRQFGSGPDLLLIAGQASPMNVWPASLLAAIAEHARVTIYDNRDLGYSTATERPFTLENLADDAAGLIAALGLDRPDVFGWSTGGEIGLLLAARYPASLSSLAITGATPGGPHSELPPPELIECAASDTPTCDLLAALFADSPSGVDAKNRFIADYVKLGPGPPSVPGVAGRYDQAEKTYWSSDEPNFDAITTPVLVMNGELDPIVPPSNARYIAQRIGDNATLEIDPGGLHGWFIEHQDRFLAILTDFLN